MSTQEQLLTLLLNSKRGEDLPLLTTLNNTDFIIVFDNTNGVIAKISKENLGVTASSGSFSKIPITINLDGQTTYILPTKPDNIDVVINRVHQHQNIDYTYTNQTGTLVITNTSVANSITTSSLIDVYGFNNSLAKKVHLVITSANQTIFNISDKPKYVNIVLNRIILSEGTDYTYNTITGVLEIINASFISQITLNSILEARKIF